MIAFLNIDIGGMGMFVFIPVLLVLGVIGAIVAYKREKARREAMLALASELGLSFNPDSDQMPSLDPPGRTRSPHLDRPQIDLRSIPNEP